MCWLDVVRDHPGISTALTGSLNMARRGTREKHEKAKFRAILSTGHSAFRPPRADHAIPPIEIGMNTNLRKPRRAKNLGNSRALRPPDLDKQPPTWSQMPPAPAQMARQAPARHRRQSGRPADRMAASSGARPASRPRRCRAGSTRSGRTASRPVEPVRAPKRAAPRQAQPAGVVPRHGHGRVRDIGPRPLVPSRTRPAVTAGCSPTPCRGRERCRTAPSGRPPPAPPSRAAGRERRP